MIAMSDIMKNRLTMESKRRRRQQQSWRRPPPVRHSDAARRSCFFLFPKDMPKECLMTILSCVEGDDIRQISQVNRYFRRICHQDAFHLHDHIRTIQINCTGRSWKRLFRKIELLHLRQTFSRGGCNYKLQLIVDLDNFKKLHHRGGDDDENENDGAGNSEAMYSKKKNHQHICIKAITQLAIVDISESSNTNEGSSSSSLRNIFTRLFKKEIDEIDKAKVVASRPVLTRFATTCPNIKQISWKGHKYAMSILGDSLRNLNNLREIHMDSAIFYTDNHHNNNNNHNEPPPPYLIFQNCKQHLERVDIRSVKVQNFTWSSGMSLSSPSSNNLIACYQAKPIPQETLMEFARQTATLRWFRSDLNEFNISILKQERSEIEFISI